MDIFKNVQNEIHGPRMLQKSEFTRVCCKSRKNNAKNGCINFYFSKTGPFKKLRENRKKPIKFRLFKTMFLYKNITWIMQRYPTVYNWVVAACERKTGKNR